MREVAAGMLYMSSQGFIHRDLALRNILATKSNSNRFTVKIADYGYFFPAKNKLNQKNLACLDLLLKIIILQKIEKLCQ